MTHTRRTFIGTSAVAALHAAPSLPTRDFGQTGRRISIVAFGCGSRFLAYKNEDEAIGVIHKAIVRPQCRSHWSGSQRWQSRHGQL